MEKVNLNEIKVTSVEIPIGFLEALFNFFDKIDRPFTEKEPFINTFRESFRVAQYKEYLRLEAEKKANEEPMNNKNEEPMPNKKE